MPRIVSAINVCCEAILAHTESSTGSQRWKSDAKTGASVPDCKKYRTDDCDRDTMIQLCVVTFELEIQQGG